MTDCMCEFCGEERIPANELAVLVEKNRNAIFCHRDHVLINLIIDAMRAGRNEWVRQAVDEQAALEWEKTA